MQNCYFEPALPLFWLGGGWGWYDYGFGWDNGYDQTEDMNSAEMPTGIAPELPSETETPNSSEGAASDYVPKYLELDRRFFVLVLKNGTTHVVATYWLEDGYLEYTSRDGTRSHIPIEALNLQDTVSENSARGQPFVLRSTPGSQ